MCLLVGVAWEAAAKLLGVAGEVSCERKQIVVRLMTGCGMSASPSTSANALVIRAQHV